MFAILDVFVGKDVIVKVDGVKLEGRLISYKHSQKVPHIPETLILRDSRGRETIIKSFDLIEVI